MISVYIFNIEQRVKFDSEPNYQTALFEVELFFLTKKLIF